MTVRLEGEARKVAWSIALAKFGRTERPYFVCPDCCTFTAHPDDVANSYCFRCHEFKFDNFGQVKCFQPTCPDFGDKDFGEGTCPQEHAVPPARREKPRD